MGFSNRSSNTASPDLRGKRLMVVEDDFSSRFYLTRLLQKTGAEVLESPSGQDALGTIQKDDRISVVFMDLQMPGFDGYETARRMRALGKDLLLIAQTACSLPEDAEMIIKSGFDDCLTKPIYQEDLYRIINKHLDRF